VRASGGGESGQDSSTGCSTYKADAAGQLPDILIAIRLTERVSIFKRSNNMAHGPAVKLGKDNASGYKTRIGIWMFTLYTLIYAGFITINTVKPTLMEVTFGGLNLAMIYGIGLIVFAFILALIYNNLCTKAEIRLNK
jgi:uncharacterized membrane protein (DUF485 family)